MTPENEIESDESTVEEHPIVRRPPKKKVKRRIVVVQSSSESEEEIEVKLPRTKKEAPKPVDEKQAKYERSMSKLFTLG